MADAKKTVVIGFVGSTLDQGRRPDRWQRWRPTLSLLMHEDLLVDELVLLHDRQHHNLVKSIAADAKEISPQTEVSGHKVSIKDPWDFAEVYGALYDFVKIYPFDVEKKLFTAYHDRNACCSNLLVFIGRCTLFASSTHSKFT